MSCFHHHVPVKALAVALLALTLALLPVAPALAAGSSTAAGGPASAALAHAPALAASGAMSLEAAAQKAGDTGRKVAMSMIALGFAIASIVLAFRRDFKEAAGVFAIGIVAILLATPAGVNVLHDTVNTLFGG